MNADRPPRRIVDGVLLLDKPLGLSSNAALQRAKRLLEARKAGHTGTLDPLATGLLPLCFGEATKFAQSLLDAPKRYTATVRFGRATTTGDTEGETVEERPVNFTGDELLAALAALVGPGLQIPHAYSALKRDGRAYYEYARLGIDVERTPREVEIHSLSLLDWTPPDAVVDVCCSKGTYVRVLAEDLGRSLGCAAHLAALRRTATGAFELGGAVTLADLEAMDRQARLGLLLPVDAPLAAMPRAELPAASAAALACGQRPSSALPPGRYRAYGPDGGFLGTAEADGLCLRAVRLAAVSDHAAP